ncbi:hypothetical protein NL526_29065, partial [Klebsiella pneumoniae]|nr:hypothetical protein [Klebsiella pneumoniae]
FYSAIIYTAYYEEFAYSIISNTLTVYFILLACLIKSSILPWIWLPRAMEGPTPSTALFYGGLATHIPAYLFLTIWSAGTAHNTF